jgi:thiamine biosynthesis lipoprotein
MSAEAIERFECFGGDCAVLVIGDGPAGGAEQAAGLARRRLLEWHRQFSRFLEDSELSLLNGDPREVVPVSPLMARLARSVGEAGARTGGLVDGTLVEEIQNAGYRDDLSGSLDLERALALAPPRRSARAAAEPRWRELRVDSRAGTLARPPGLMLDSGGLAKGMFADVLGELLSGHESFAVNCGGDLLIGGSGRRHRTIAVQSPFDGSTLHVFEEREAGVATSGIGRRSWIGADGRPAHHLLDPSTGMPAFTGIVQATALAPTALLAEARAKAAVLAGPLAARRWLGQGGVIVLDDGSHQVIERPPTINVRRDELGGVALSGPVFGRAARKTVGAAV